MRGGKEVFNFSCGWNSFLRRVCYYIRLGVSGERRVWREIGYGFKCLGIIILGKI